MRREAARLRGGWGQPLALLRWAYMNNKQSVGGITAPPAHHQGRCVLGAWWRAEKGAHFGKQFVEMEGLGENITAHRPKVRFIISHKLCRS